MENKIKYALSTPHMSEEGYEKKYVDEAFKSNWIAPLGPMVDGFEEDVIKFTGSKYACALSSGSAAIHLALKSIGIKEGDIVFCQSLTFSATANPILYEKAIPVFIDSEEETWNLSPKYLREAFTKYPNVKAVIVVHLYGIPAKMDEIIQICNYFKVPLIEDAAESLGSMYKGKHTGTFGEIGILSFNGNKIITTSGGGMVLSKNFEKINKIRYWATQARDKARHYQHSEIGYNYRISNISAAIGRGQMLVLEKRIQKKREIFFEYKKNLSRNSNISFVSLTDDYFPNYWLSTIILKNISDVLPLIIFLENNGIESRPLWKPMHLQPLYKSFDFIGNSFSDYLFNHGICLPSDTKFGTEDISFISNKVLEYFSK